jgi:hypothetical protein
MVSNLVVVVPGFYDVMLFSQVEQARAMGNLTQQAIRLYPHSPVRGAAMVTREFFEEHCVCVE